MNPEAWTSLSGLLVSVSGIYYGVLVYLRQAPGNPIAWATWGVISIALFLTSNTSLGLNAMTFGVINPIAIAVIGAWRQIAEAKRPTRRELIGGGLGVIAIILWLTARKYDAPSEWTLGLSILADCIPLWIIIRNAWERPWEDKPFAWTFFAFGFGISALGLQELSPFTLALPVYMFVGANLVALPLVMYRLRHRTPIRGWM